MSDRRNIPVRVFTFSLEDQERLLEETILEWRALGPAVAWNAIYDMLGFWFAARGLDPEAQRVDLTHLEIRPVPWLAGDAGKDPCDLATLEKSSPSPQRKKRRRGKRDGGENSGLASKRLTNLDRPI